MDNIYVNNEELIVCEYCESLYNIYDNQEVIKYLFDYHIRVDSFSFFIGLCEEELIDIHKPISYEDNIIVEDWRMVGGSSYYTIKRKLFENYICIGDILEQLKNNNEMKRLLNDKDNENIVLVDIMKSIHSNIHFYLYFDSNM
jgi:hypothetical protein